MRPQVIGTNQFKDQSGIATGLLEKIPDTSLLLRNLFKPFPILPNVQWESQF